MLENTDLVTIITSNKDLLETTVGEYQTQLQDFLTYLHLPQENILVKLKNPPALQVVMYFGLCL